MLTVWLATSDIGADLLTELEDMRESHGAIGMLHTKAGRALVDAVMSDFYAATG